MAGGAEPPSACWLFWDPFAEPLAGRPRPPRPLPPRRRRRPAPVPCAAEPEPAAAGLGSVSAVSGRCAVAEPVSSFMVAPFELGGAMPASAGEDSLGTPEVRRVRDWPSGLVPSDPRSDAGAWVPASCGASLRSGSPRSRLAVRSRPSGVLPGAGVAGASPLQSSPASSRPRGRALGEQVCPQDTRPNGPRPGTGAAEGVLDPVRAIDPAR
jgi:hypothetical protein